MDEQASFSVGAGENMGALSRTLCGGKQMWQAWESAGWSPLRWFIGVRVMRELL